MTICDVANTTCFSHSASQSGARRQAGREQALLAALTHQLESQHHSLRLQLLCSAHFFMNMRKMLYLTEKFFFFSAVTLLLVMNPCSLASSLVTYSGPFATIFCAKDT